MRFVEMCRASAVERGPVGRGAARRRDVEPQGSTVRQPEARAISPFPFAASGALLLGPGRRR